MSKDTHFIDTEVEELPWTSWDDYDTYCENSERVFDAICDEAALYKIASEAVKKKLDSLNAYGKYYKEQYDKARDKIDELKQTIQNMEKTNTDLHKEIDNAKLEASKELYENYLRTQNPLGVISGDIFYSIEITYGKEDCPYCGGTEEIITQYDKVIKCPKCYQGKIEVRKGFDIIEKKCTSIDSFTTYNNKTIYRYIDYNGDEFMPYGQDDSTPVYRYAFKTREDAQKFIDSQELNK